MHEELGNTEYMNSILLSLRRRGVASDALGGNVEMVGQKQTVLRYISAYVAWA